MVFSMSTISDALHGLHRRQKEKVRSERYYYTDNKLFEQSLDIYRPAATERKASNADERSTTSSSSSSRPIVALVVGSAWLGHRSFVYSPTSWWNSSGPKAVAELGYECVCVSFMLFSFNFNISAARAILSLYVFS